MEPVNGNHEAPATETMDGPTAATQVDAMDTTTDGPPAEVSPHDPLYNQSHIPPPPIAQRRANPTATMQPQLSTQPESTAQPDANPPPPIPQPATATASPKSEPPVATESQPRPGVQTVREVLNTKINPFVSAGLRQIFRDPDNVYVPL